MICCLTLDSEFNEDAERISPVKTGCHGDTCVGHFYFRSSRASSSLARDKGGAKYRLNGENLPQCILLIHRHYRALRRPCVSTRVFNY